MKQFFTTDRPVRGRSGPGWFSKLLLPALLLGQGYRAQAQFPRFESFKNNTANGFTFGGTPNAASLTGTGATGADATGAGYLRLTDATTNQSGYAIDQVSFPAPTGFTVSFEFFSYGGSGADGFSVFMIDADKTSAATFTPGASGGSLGYAQKTVTPISNGVPNGYIGIGIDEFGNFANPNEGRVGGPGSRADAVSIRGAGNGQSTTDYPYLTGSGVLPFSLDVGAASRVTAPSDPNYRRAYISVVPKGTAPNVTYLISVRIQHGNAITTAVDNFNVPAPPANLRLGFAGSTGGSTNIHEIRNLAIVQAPVANNDVATTIYNAPVQVRVLSNDQFFGSDFLPGSVDFDLGTAGVQNTYTVAGKGTFSAADDGTVTFTPSGTFAGVVTIPYLMQDLAGSRPTGTNPQYFSNPAELTIIVKGADLASSVSGPTSANPGARVTYTVNTSNLGTEPALNVVPTLQLPAGLTSVVVSSGSYNATSGLVTFGAVANMAAGAAPIVNTVVFTAPASGPVLGTAAFIRPPNVPDPVTANDVATITTTVTGLTNAAGVCATPGKDGPVTLTGTTSPNTYYPGTASAAKGATSISVGAPVGSTTPIAAGDLLLVMQMQGAEIDNSNNSTYGSGMANNGAGILSTNYTAGVYEYVTAAGPVDANGSVPLTVGLANAYSNDAATGGVGQRRFQVVRVPQYSSLTIAGAVTSTEWNGLTGGILALDVAGATTFNTGGSLTMTGKGFRGAGGKKYAGNTSYLTNDYVRLAPTTEAGAHASKGEGIVGTPLFVNNNGPVLTNATDGYPGGSLGRGAPGNAGGGGSDVNPTNNGSNTGGGGGANGGGGGGGGTFNYANNAPTFGGVGGAAIGSASASRLVLGGGGGAGTTNNTNNTDAQSSGGDGGGIIIFRTGLVSGTGTIVANGDAGSNAADNGGGGGGAGGTVLVAVQTTADVAKLTVQATGGVGGNTITTGTNNYGTGGGGGGGLVYANGALNAASLVTGAANGTNTANRNIASSGATAGGTGTISNVTIPIALASVGACLPTFNVALATSTPNVTRAAGNVVNPAMYTLTLSNTGGTATNVSATASLIANMFAYDPAYTPVATLQTADGATFAAPITAPTTGNSTPTFGAAFIPAGATLSITFRATIASAAVNNTPYQASATITYTDPTRTTSSQTTGPGLNYATNAAAPGANYVASSSTAEDVTIVVPLPVVLTRFTVAAVRADAQLRWTTASEQNNDHFVVERSLDGVSFEAVGTVRGQGTSLKAADYEFVDAGAARRTAAGQPLYYRLRQVDFEGPSTYSPVRSVVFGTKGALSVYPNPTPAGRVTTLDLRGLPTGSYQVQVLDLTGRAVAQYSLTGGAEHPLELKALASGTYVVRVQGGALSQSLLLTKE